MRTKIINQLIRRLRKDYVASPLSKDSVEKNPFDQFEQWFEDTVKANVFEPNAMILSTVSKEHKPSSRAVLLKEVDETGFTFFTNYFSRKGTELANNAHAALLFYWPECSRQIHIEGKVQKITEGESNTYFHSRPREAQLSAVASEQSRIIPNRDVLEKKVEELTKRFKGKEISKPGHWGGYRLVPGYFEFWQGRQNRLHDRIAYEKNNEDWNSSRLAP